MTLLTKTQKILKTMRLFAALVLGMALFCQPVFSQSHSGSNFNRVSIGLNAGILTPFTDIQQKDYFPVFDEIKLGAGLKLEYHVTPVFAFRGQFLTGKLNGIDTQSENKYFETELWEASFGGMLSLSKLLAPRWSRNDRIDIYSLLGVGMVAYRSKLFDSNNDQLLNSYGYLNNGADKDTRLKDLAIPVGLGLQVNLSPRIDLTFETGYRFTQTDKLDGLRRVFSRYDAYNYTNIGLAIKIGKNTSSMNWAWPSVVMYPGDIGRFDQMTERIAEVNRQVVIIEQSLRDGAYDRDIAELRQLMQAIDVKQNELDNRLTSSMEQKSQNVETSVASLLSVFFRLNSAVVDNFNYERIAAAARFMAANPNVKVTLVGHTDNTGPSAFNMALSERRSKAVYDILVDDFKIDSSRLSTSFRGPNDPLSEQNRNVNRRVDFVVVE